MPVGLRMVGARSCSAHGRAHRERVRRPRALPEKPVAPGLVAPEPAFLRPWASRTPTPADEGATDTSVPVAPRALAMA